MNVSVACTQPFASSSRLLFGEQYRAPEEFASRDLNEQIDVFSFGSNIYALLTGLWVFYDNDNDAEVQVGDHAPCSLSGATFVALVCSVLSRARFLDDRPGCTWSDLENAHRPKAALY